MSQSFVNGADEISSMERSSLPLLPTPRIRTKESDKEFRHSLDSQRMLSVPNCIHVACLSIARSELAGLFPV